MNAVFVALGPKREDRVVPDGKKPGFGVVVNGIPQHITLAAGNGAV